MLAGALAGLVPEKRTGFGKPTNKAVK